METPLTAVLELRRQLEKYRGYFLNPDADMTQALLEGLLVNQARYGYPFCPCRLAEEDYERDKDLICPCDYRDQDIREFGTCFCGLYVSREAAMGKKSVTSIPERRENSASPNLIWRCKVCGYLCARPQAPDICPICGVTHDRFEVYSGPLTPTV